MAWDGPIYQLVRLAGPPVGLVDLAHARRLTIGRLASNAIVLDHAQVSREHALLEFEPSQAGPTSAGTGLRTESDHAGPRSPGSETGSSDVQYPGGELSSGEAGRGGGGPGVWMITDLHSKHGTRVNGTAIPPGKPCVLEHGDIVDILPWSFQFIDRSTQAAAAGEAAGGSAGGEGGSVGATDVQTLDDTRTAHATIAPIDGGDQRELDRERLQLILQCAEMLQQVKDERSLAEAVLQAAARGTGFRNIAMLRPMTADGSVSVIGCIGDLADSRNTPTLSRSLIAEAANGRPVHLAPDLRARPRGESIMLIGIKEAICIPLLAETTVIGFLYMDNRDEAYHTPVGHVATGAFAVGLGRLASMALANLKRQELERRYARMEGELAAAAGVQRSILPPREGACGPVRFVGECRPGRIISGDFYDVFALPAGRVAMMIGDVAGKGVPASVLMTTAQGFLHGALMQHGEAARAVSDLNAYLSPRCEGGKFITLWVGVFDPQLGTLSYVNAGHGYAWQVASSRAVRMLDGAGGPAVGATPMASYAAGVVGLERGDRVVLVSDGIIEQPGRPLGAQLRGEAFGRARLESLLPGLDGSEGLTRLFNAVIEHAQSPSLADDATVVVADVSWGD